LAIRGNIQFIAYVCNVGIISRNIQFIAYVYNVGIISRNLRALEEALQEVDNTAQDIGLIINQEKLKFIKVRRRTIIVGR